MERSFEKGLEHLKRNEAILATEEFKKVLRVYPQYEPVYLNLANSYAQQGDPKKSKYFYNHARRLCLINSEIFSERGLVYAKYKESLQSKTDFYNEHVLKYYPSRLFSTHEKEQK